MDNHTAVERYYKFIFFNYYFVVDFCANTIELFRIRVYLIRLFHTTIALRTDSLHQTMETLQEKKYTFSH